MKGPESKYVASLSLLYFLQFAVWGCYLTCLGQLLGAGGLGRDIAWFYAAVGFVSFVMPALMGHIADRYVSPARLLGLCHGAAALAMLAAWRYAMTHPMMDFAPFFGLYVLFLAFYMPTMALANTTAFGILKSRGLRPVDVFPRIRVWGTVGFVAAMWFVNSAYWHDGAFGFTLSDAGPMSAFRFQYTPMQLLASSVIGFVTAFYTLSLPCVRPMAQQSTGLGEHFREMFTFFRNAPVRTFLLLAALSGVCLQISNGFATPFISSFMADPAYAGTLAAGNATMLFSLSQISEAVCVLFVGWCMKRFGIRSVLITALVAWALRFLLFAFGNPGGGLWMLIGSMLVYGVAFNFLTIAGNIYMDQSSAPERRGLGQGVLMLMSNGIGASLGTLCAGGVVNSFCHWQQVSTESGATMRLFIGDWQSAWLIFVAYALVVALLYFICFRPAKTPKVNS